MEDVEREAELLALARHATAAQLETIVRGWRRVVAAEDAQRAFEARYLSLSYDDDGSVLVRGRLAPEEGAVLRKALEAARDALIAEARRADPGGGVPAETPDRTVDDADALAALAESALAGELAQRCGGERYQVVVHVEPAPLRGEPDQMERCALEDGTPIAAATVQRMCCDASLVGLVERDGRAVSVGRKTRAVPPAMRRALRSRDGGCRLMRWGMRSRRWRRTFMPRWRAGWRWSPSSTRARGGRPGGVVRVRSGCRGAVRSRRGRRASTSVWRGGCESCRWSRRPSRAAS